MNCVNRVNNVTTFQSQKFIQINKVPYEVRIWEYNNQEDISMNCVNCVNNVYNNFSISEIYTDK